jgi:hypothetical protein
MTIDVEAESACVDWSLAYTNLWDRYFDLCDALCAEREKVRALYQFLVEWDQQDSFREPDYRDQLLERYAAWIETARTALAATEDGGGA